ncbi:HNH endonuclease signature motif containing protein [Streptomyces sp. NPDC047108]|uniref:HNH endonuclease signature motif containing protein n=1 Tax=Streptomyces sp. NPDC047108 TaxID=3155025 RepID=UPI0033CACA7F
MLEYLDVPIYDGAYSYVAKKLDRFGIDTSHFTKRHRNGGKALVPRGELTVAVAESKSVAGVLRALGQPNSGSARARVQRSIAAYGMSTAHFVGQGHRRGRPSPARKSAAEILRCSEPGSRRTKTALLRRALNESGVARVCGCCGLGEVWMGQRLVLEIDHLNGDRLDNRIDNLRYLCPSCHSQTRTFSGRRSLLSPTQRERSGQ